MPYLIQDPEAPNPEIHPLRVGSNTIGRELDNTLMVMHKSLSRHHAEIVVTQEQTLITDLGALNGTFVNDTKITQCELQDGDVLRCGSVAFKFVKALEPPKLELPPISDEELEQSIVKRLPPEQTRVVLQDLLQQDSSPQQGTALKLRHQDADRRAVDKLKILLEVSKQLSSPKEPDRLLEKILDLLFEIMDVDRAVILMVNEETGELENKALKLQPGIPTDEPFYSTTITNLVYQNGDAVLIADTDRNQQVEGSFSLITQAIQASMCVPLKPRDQVIGVLYVDNLSLANVYSEEDLEFLTGLVNQAAIAIENAQLYKRSQSEAIMRAKLESFFPQTVTKKLREDDYLEIIDTEVTALFADISGFTKLSSKMKPRQIIEMLNEYFKVMVEDIVFPLEGTLEKYIGDALLAVWGAPYQQPDDANRAIQAAIAMQKAVRCLNAEWRERRNLQIQIHIGINTGPVAAGNIGSEKLIQYATIGDTTNVTSRICGVAKADEILISQSTVECLSADTLHLEKIPPVMVKGKDQPLQLYRLHWDAD